MPDANRIKGVKNKANMHTVFTIIVALAFRLLLCVLK
jgi:hypothetical protein